MPRGRPRKLNPNIPPHIDQAKIPRGIYWDNSGAGRWVVRDPEFTVVAGPAAKLSDLHAIAEARKGEAAAGTIAFVLKAYHASLDFQQLAASTRRHYDDYRKAIKAYPVKHGTLGDLFVDRLGPPVFRHLFNTIAAGVSADQNNGQAIPGYPTKANHWLRYLRRAFGWGIEYGKCKTNPCRGVKCVREVRDHRMPEREVFRAVQEYARRCSLKKAREKGCLPPYLWAAMELAYQARLRGIEVLTLTDAHDLEEDLQTNRRKGSRDNLVRKGTATGAAIAALREYRTKVWDRKRREVQIRPENRPLFVGEDGEQLTRAGFNTAWGRLMRNAIEDKVITEPQRFGMHGLKHRGVTDTKGTRADKKDASGHVTDSMASFYDHDLPRVEPADDA